MIHDDNHQIVFFIVSDDLSKVLTSIQATGCPDPDLSYIMQEYRGWVKKKDQGKDRLKKWWNICKDVRDGNANEKEIRRCCSFTPCRPTFCTRKYKWQTGRKYSIIILEKNYFNHFKIFKLKQFAYFS